MTKYTSDEQEQIKEACYHGSIEFDGNYGVSILNDSGEEAAFIHPKDISDGSFVYITADNEVEESLQNTFDDLIEPETKADIVINVLRFM